MRYELRTRQDGEPVVLTGAAPEYAADFDSTTIRDGLVYYRAFPVDGHGNEIDIQSPQYGAVFSPPPFRGLMVNNRTLDMSKPLIVFGAETEPYSGELDGPWTPEQLLPHLTFAATLMDHLQAVGYVPGMCFGDYRTIVIDPADPLAQDVRAVDNPVDMLGEPAAGVPRWNSGTLCLPGPFFEIRRPNGIPDIWEHTARDNVQAYARYGSVTNGTDAAALYVGISERLTADYQAAFDAQSYFAFKKPVRYAEPENLLKEKLRGALLSGVTSVLLYDVYVKTNDFEMSVGSWPQYQNAVDELNEELGTAVRIGAITANSAQLMHYDNFLRSLFLGVRDTITTAGIPPGKKLGIILVEHGIGRAGRLYDVLSISTPALNERMAAYFAARMGALYDDRAKLAISYIAGTYPPAHNVTEVGEQVATWVAQGYEHIVVYPAEWFWESRQTYCDLRQAAVGNIDEDNTEIFERDARDRSEALLDGTRVIISETTLSKKTACPAAYHYLQAAAAQHLEDRLIAMTGAIAPAALAGTLFVSGGNIQLTLPFSDTLLTSNDRITLQNAGIRVRGAATSPQQLTGSIDTGDMEHYLFALLAEHAVAVEGVRVSEASLSAITTDGIFSGSIEAQAVVAVRGGSVSVRLQVDF
jgi:hypothetical protein